VPLRSHQSCEVFFFRQLLDHFLTTTHSRHAETNFLTTKHSRHAETNFLTSTHSRQAENNFLTMTNFGHAETNFLSTTNNGLFFTTRHSRHAQPKISDHTQFQPASQSSESPKHQTCDHRSKKTVLIIISHHISILLYFTPNRPWSSHYSVLSFYQVRQGRTWSRSYKSPPPPPNYSVLVFFLNHQIFFLKKFCIF
jgi:hypothetical protein